MQTGDDDVDLNENVFMEGTSITLADIAGLNLDEIKEERFESLPKGVFIFEVEKAWLGKFGEGEKAKGGVGVKCKVMDVITCSDPSVPDPSVLVGKVHNQTFFITQLKSIGYIKAFFKDIGAPSDSNFNQMLAKAAGTRFQGPIGKRKDPNDSDKEYTQIVQNKVKPLGSSAGEVSSVAKAVA